MSDNPPRRATARTSGLVCAGLVAAAALLWAGSAAVWFGVTVPGRAAVEFTGAEVSPAPGGVALLALTGVAAVVATGGLLRRVVGALLSLAGGAVGVIAVRALVADPFATEAPASTLPQPPPGVPVDALRYQPVDVSAAPLLAVAGAALLLVAGLFVLVAEPRLARLGSRYSAGRTRQPDIDPDRKAWQDLDAGRDPTVDAPPDRADDPGEQGRQHTA